MLHHPLLFSSCPGRDRAGSTCRADPRPLEQRFEKSSWSTVGQIEPARPPSSWLDRIELMLASSWLDPSSWLEAVRAGSKNRAGSLFVELARPIELARPESSQLDRIELARASSWLDSSSQLGAGRAGSTHRATRPPSSQLDPIEPARLRAGQLEVSILLFSPSPHVTHFFYLTGLLLQNM